MRQFLENEAVIRTKGLVGWSGFTVAEIAARMEAPKRQRQQDDAVTAQELTAMLAADVSDDSLDDSTMAALGHIAGYLSRSVTKRGECESCADPLIDRQSPPLEVQLEESLEQMPPSYAHFTELLDRGKLIRPSSTAIELTSAICVIWRSIVRDEVSRRRLFGCYLPRSVSAEVVIEASSVNLISRENGDVFDIKCSGGHELKTVMKRIACSLYNLFAGNMVRDINSDLHSRRKISANRKSGGKRSREDDNRHKLCGIKKE